MKKPYLTLIIPAYNEEKLIYKTLMSVTKAARQLELVHGSTMEIIVVNNDSNDRTVEIAERFGVTMAFEALHNIAAVRNRGAQAAQGEVLCFLDADSEVSEDLFCHVYETMQSGAYVGGGTRMKLDRKGLFFDTLVLGASVMSHLTKVSGVMIFARKDIFDSVKGFDEKLYAGEDLKFIFRLKKEGKKMSLVFKNIYDSYVITSARKFKTMSLKDLFVQGALILNHRLMEDPKLCYTWYDLGKRGE